MKQTKIVTYRSCDLCNGLQEAVGQCSICGKDLCQKHFCRQQCPILLAHSYGFCLNHYVLVHSIIEQTEIPIVHIINKLSDTPNISLTQEFDARYAPSWKQEWETQV